MMTPNDEKEKDNKDLLKIEADFAKKHKHDTDEELMQYLRNAARKLGHLPKKREVPGYALIKSRFGPWPRVLEMAGLKEAKGIEYE
jgi:hypothetical protein